jgi:hypothetical protein
MPKQLPLATSNTTFYKKITACSFAIVTTLVSHLKKWIFSLILFFTLATSQNVLGQYVCGNSGTGGTACTAMGGTASGTVTTVSSAVLNTWYSISTTNVGGTSPNQGVQFSFTGVPAGTTIQFATCTGQDAEGYVTGPAGFTAISYDNDAETNTGGCTPGGLDETFSILCNVAGTYNVRMAVNTCVNFSAGTRYLFWRVTGKLPDAFTISGSIAPCVGSSIQYTNSASGDGASGTETWSIPAGWSAGSGGATYTVTVGSQSGNISMSRTNGCGTTTSSNTISVTPATSPGAVTVTGGAICSGQTISASGGAGGTIYWQGTTSGGTSTSGGSGTTSPAITMADTYYAIAQSSNGCWGAQGSAAVTIKPGPTSVNAGSDATICSGGSTALSGSAIGVATNASNYVFSTQTGVSLQTLSSPVSLINSSVDDAVSSVTNLPFTFNYAGTNYTQFSVNSNGLMSFGSTVVNSTRQTSSINLTSGVTPNPLIAPWWDDLTTGTNGNVRYSTIGTIPNRIFVVEWNVNTFSNEGISNTITKTTQVWLYETSNILKFVYGTGTSVTYTDGSQIGMATSTSSYIGINTTAHTSSTSSNNNGQTAWPGSGRAYTFTPPVSYSWSPATGLTATNVANPTASPTATTTYTMTATSNGCSVTDEVVVTVNNTPTANAGANQSNISPGTAIQLNGAATNYSSVSWAASIAGTFSPNNTSLNPTFTPTSSTYTGTVTFTLTANANAPCSNATSTMTATIQQTSICAGGTGTVTVAGGTGGTTNTYSVSIDGGATYTTATPNGSNQISINTTGATGSVKLKAVHSSAGCSTEQIYTIWSIIPANTITLTSAGSTTTQTVNVNNPITSITYTTTGATGATISGLPSGVTGSWSSGTVTISGTPTVANTYTYTVTMTGGCTGGTNTATGTITVNGATNTVSAASSTPTVCVNSALTSITHTTTGATGISNSGVSGANGLPPGVSATWASNTITISGTPTSGGVYNYSIPLTGGFGSVSATGTITVTALPNVSSFSASGNNVCIGFGNTITVSSSSLITGTYTVTYNVSGANTASGLTATLNFTAGSPGTGTFTTGTLTASGSTSVTVTQLTTSCGSSAVSSGNVAAFTVNPSPATPTASYNGAGTGVCEATALSLSASGSTGTYTWSGPNGYTATGSSPSVSASATSAMAGTYSVYSTSSGCQSQTATVSVTINSVGITLGSNPQVCRGETSADLTYSAVSGAPNRYSIDYNAAANTAGFTDVSLATIPTNPAIVLTVPATVAVGTYSANLTVNNSTNGCTSSTYPITITVNALPTITLAASPTVCARATTANLAYTAQSGANQYAIDFDATAETFEFTDVTYTALGSSPVSVPSSTAAVNGIYNANVTVKNTTTGCISTPYAWTITVTSPTVTASASPDLLCVTGGTSTVTATGANTYVWSTGATTNSITPTVSSTTIYTVTGTRTSDGCTAIATATVSVGTQATLLLHTFEDATTSSGWSGQSTSAPTADGNYWFLGKRNNYANIAGWFNRRGDNCTDAILSGDYSPRVHNCDYSVLGNSYGCNINSVIGVSTSRRLFSPQIIATNYGSLKVKYKLKGSLTAANNVKLQYSTNGTSWTDLTTYNSGVSGSDSVSLPSNLENTTFYLGFLLTTTTSTTSTTSFVFDDFQVTGTFIPTTPSAPTGVTSRCTASGVTNTYTVAAVPNTTSYVWSISPGAAGSISGTGTTATVTWSSGWTGTATISVKARNCAGFGCPCEDGASSPGLSVIIYAQPSVTSPMQIILHLQEL